MANKATSNRVMTSFVRPTTLTAKLRRKLASAMADSDICGGREKVPSKGAGLTEITRILSDHGYSLDMVYGDDILGKFGTRLIGFRPTNDTSEAFIEFDLFRNAAINFTWENLSETGATPRYEIIAYVS